MAASERYRGFTEAQSQDASSGYELLNNNCSLLERLLTHLQYVAAAKQSNLDPTSKAMISLAGVLKGDRKLQSILGTPTLQPSDKKQIVAELEKHTGGADKSGTVKNFLSTLAENNRLGILESVCEKFGQLMSAAHGEMELNITSAQVRSEPADTLTREKCY